MISSSIRTCPKELYGSNPSARMRRSELAKRGEATRSPYSPWSTKKKRRPRGVVDGRPIAITAKEFALLAYLCERAAGAVREQTCSRGGVGVNRYEGGPRTSTFTCRRLRAKLGDALRIARNARGSATSLRAPRSRSKRPHATIRRPRRRRRKKSWKDAESNPRMLSAEQPRRSG